MRSASKCPRRKPSNGPPAPRARQERPVQEAEEVTKVRPANPQSLAPIIHACMQESPAFPAGFSLEQCRAMLGKGYRCLAVTQDGQIIGAVGFVRDRIHLAILPPYRGRWGSETVGQQILAYGFKFSPQLVAIIDAGDALTQRIATAFGFRLEGQEGRWQRWLLRKPATPLPAPQRVA